MKKLFSQTTFLAIVACLLWSSAFVGVKIGLQYHTPLQFAGIRFIISGLLIFPIIKNGKRYWKELKENLGFAILIGFLQVALQYSLFYSGINLLPGSISAMIIGSSPLFIAVVAHYTMHNDKMTLLKSSSIVLGIIGVVIISMRKELPSGAQIAFTGVIFLVLNNLVSGISNVVIAKKNHTISPLVLTSSSLIIGGIVLYGFSIPLEGLNVKHFPPVYYVALGWLSFLSAAAISIWNTLLRRPNIKVSDLNTWKFLIPVSGAILSWLILPNESPDSLSVTGMLIIGSSLLILNLANRKLQRKK